MKTTVVVRLHRTCRKVFTFSTSASALLLQPDPPLQIHKLRKRRQEFAALLQLPGKPLLRYKRAHAQIVVWGFQDDVFIANSLLSVYSKSGSLAVARRVFDKMPRRNLISWSSLVSMYSQHGCTEEALMIFLDFRRCCEDRPNEFILASVMHACTHFGTVHQGTQLHCFVVKIGFDQEIYVGTTLVNLYSKVGDMENARLAFDHLSQKSAVTWSTIITAYVKCGRSEVSLQLFKKMRETDVIPDRHVLSSILTACSNTEFLEGGKQIHAHMLRTETEMDGTVVNVLIDFYAKCGRVRIARKVFDQMEFRSVISWTTMIAGCMKNTLHLEAMKLFVEMMRLGLRPDGFGCTSILTSCGSLEALEQGKQVHCYAIKANFDSDDFVKNGLIDMYGKCNSLAGARRAFDMAVDRNLVSYNAMIEGYSSQGKVYEALDLFHQLMRLRSFPPSLLTFVSLLGVSASLLTLELSRQIHGLILKFGISLDVFAGSALIDVYSKCSLVRDARLVFDEMKERDIAVWNAMLFGYSQQLENEEALKLYQKMQSLRQKPNGFTFVALVAAASNLASLPQGQQFHGQLVKAGLDSEPFVTNALADMYAKCGNIEGAHKAFSHMTWRDVVCWNSMITTYAHHGRSDEALQAYEGLLRAGIKPNYATFVGVLSACSHAGLVGEGLQHFESMHEFGIEPGTNHYACLVSLLCRAGQLIEAKEFIEKMPIKPAAMIWKSLLSACRVSGNVELGQCAAEMAISSDPADSGSYILLSNIFASKGMWANVKRVRERMERSGVVKEPGRSWIEVQKRVHVFKSRDKSHSEADLFFPILDCLIKHIKVVGCVPDTTTLMTNDP